MFKKTLRKKVRRIKNVDSWNGKASNYSSAEAFADASLINYNPVTDRGNDPEKWVKSLIRLPVRGEGDGSDVFVDKAIITAAGGRGIQALTRPDEVTDSDFTRLVRNAANTLIGAYDEMDKIAPDAIFELAGKDAPARQVLGDIIAPLAKRAVIGVIGEAVIGEKERAVPVFSIWDRVMDAIYETEMGGHLIDIYVDDDMSRMFAIIVMEGRLFKVDIMVSGGEVLLGQFKELDIDIETQSMRMIVRQTISGGYRWLAIVATTALNRVGEIDSRNLFDSFLAYAKEANDYPILNFYHQGNRSRLGKADYLARDDNCYIASGQFDNNEFGHAAARGIMDDPDFWGNSIEFTPLAGEIMKVRESGAVIEIPVFTSGINTAISVLPESDAAALFTNHTSPKRDKEALRMNQAIKDTLTKLFVGNEELADDFEEHVDGVNREINDELVHRATDTEEEVVKEVVKTTETEVEEEVTGETVADVETPVEGDVEFVLDETVIPGIAQELLRSEQFVTGVMSVVEQALRNRDETIELLASKLIGMAEELEAMTSSVNQRLAILETDEESRRRQWQDDLPSAPVKKVVSFRPRERADGDTPMSLGELATETLSTIYGNQN